MLEVFSAWPILVPIQTNLNCKIKTKILKIILITLVYFNFSFLTFRELPSLDDKHTVFGKLVGGSDVFNKIEYIETDKKDRPKTSIKIEDCLVFVDPFAEVDQQVIFRKDFFSKKSHIILVKN